MGHLTLLYVRDTACPSRSGRPHPRPREQATREGLDGGWRGGCCSMLQSGAACFAHMLPHTREPAVQASPRSSGAARTGVGLAHCDIAASQSASQAAAPPGAQHRAVTQNPPSPYSRAPRGAIAHSHWCAAASPHCAFPEPSHFLKQTCSAPGHTQSPPPPPPGTAIFFWSPQVLPLQLRHICGLPPHPPFVAGHSDPTLEQVSEHPAFSRLTPVPSSHGRPRCVRLCLRCAREQMSV